MAGDRRDTQWHGERKDSWVDCVYATILSSIWSEETETHECACFVGCKDNTTLGGRSTYIQVTKTKKIPQGNISKMKTFVFEIGNNE
jgi:hypothetical protein